MPTAVISVREMLVAVIDPDPAMRLLTSSAPGERKVFARGAPPNTPLPYVDLAGTTETPIGAGYYNRRGHLGTESIKCWAKTIWTAQQMFARLVELLDNERPVVVGHAAFKGTLEYVDDGADPDRKAHQVWARYRLRSLVVAA